MTATRIQARDDILELLKAALDTTNIAQDQVVWPNVEANPTSTQQSAKNDPAPWARVTLLHNNRGQATIGSSSGVQRYESDGILTVQLFTPTGEGLTNSDSYVILLQDTFDGVKTPHGVWFKNARAIEIGQDGPWFQTNFTVEFLYDEVK